MIGLGTWSFELNTPVFKGKLLLTILDNNGEYDFRPEFPGFAGDLEYEVLSAREDGNTLSGELTCSLIPVKKPIKLMVSILERDTIMTKYVCNICGYIYDPEVGDPDNGIAPGTAFEDLPEDWVCPLCGVGKEDFSPEE